MIRVFHASTIHPSPPTADPRGEQGGCHLDPGAISHWQRRRGRRGLGDCPRANFRRAEVCPGLLFLPQLQPIILSLLRNCPSTFDESQMFHGPDSAQLKVILRRNFFQPHPHPNNPPPLPRTSSDRTSATFRASWTAWSARRAGCGASSRCTAWAPP